MFSKKIYWISTILLFLGLFWMFLPHAFHGAILQEAGIEEESEHYIHLVEGLILTIISLIIMIWNEKQISNKKAKRL